MKKLNKAKLVKGLYLCYWKQDEFHKGYMLADWNEDRFINNNQMGGSGQVEYITHVQLLNKQYD